ncbi:hypothetical protein ACTFIZ_002314, partial [Dictyostelium cf. discoideum]
MFVQLILGAYIISIGIIYLYGVNLEIESTLVGTEKKELLKHIPFLGNLIIESLTINIFGLFSIFLSFIILVFIKSGTKFNQGQSFFEILITILGVYGLSINKTIIQEIQNYKDIIYENNWFVVKKVYTYGEKYAYMVQNIKEYCITKQINYNTEYEKIIAKKIEKVGITEIPKIVEVELDQIKRGLKGILNESTGFFNSPFRYVVYLG